MSSDPNISEQRLKRGGMDRDPNHINQHVSIVFDEIIGEPGSVHSGDCAWKNSEWCFSTVVDGVYKGLTYICALPFSCCWGIYFACVAFIHVWYLTPLIKGYSICTEYIRKLLRACLNAFLAPICEVCALCFSKIKVEQQ